VATVFGHSKISSRGARTLYRDWFFVRSFPIQPDPPTYQTCGEVAYLPKLNTDNPEVRRYLLAIAISWITEVDIDGWRLDVP
jgi:hypothetical protein